MTYSRIREASKEPALTWDESEKVPKHGIFQITEPRIGVESSILVTHDPAKIGNVLPDVHQLSPGKGFKVFPAQIIN